MRKNFWLFALLAAVGAMPGAVAQQPTMQTVGVELKGDTLVYRTTSVPTRRGSGARTCSWSTDEKLFALSKLWMEVRRNSAYLDRFGARRWDSLYRATIAPVMQSRDDPEFCRLLGDLCAQLPGNQVFIIPRRNAPLTSIGYEGGWQLRLMDVGGHVVVCEVSADKASILPPGSEILSVNGQPVGEAMSRVLDRMPRRHALKWLLYGPIGTPHEVEFRRPDGTRGSVQLVNPRYGSEPEMDTPVAALPGRSWKDLHEDFRLTWYPGDVACLKIGSFEPGQLFKAFHDALPEIRARARKLILDLRFNSRGSDYMAAELISHLTRDTVLYGPLLRNRIYDAALASWGAWAEPGDTVRNSHVRFAYQLYNDEAFSEPKREAYRFPQNRGETLVVPTVILVNNATGEAAETFLVFAASQPHMSTVGTTTSGDVGRRIRYSLLPGLPCYICVREVRLPDGSELAGRGIAPDIEVGESLDDLLSGRDPMLEKALQILGTE